MKKLILITLVMLMTHSCSKDEEAKALETPSFDWSATAVSGNTMEISITINSSEDLPEGTLEFKVDGNLINSFQALKGTKTYNTDFNFVDMETHTASLSYMFSDGRSALNKTINIKKSLQTVTQKSSKSDWVDF
ncbi:hypothetical protein [Flagellimonas sp.]|uniref:hypothetical protein n=1 Tax=Flagellimonas sp. TaxID=2058762 RepID=UPI003B5AFACC